MPAAKIFEIETPWQEADLPRLRYEQTADLAIITCYGYAPRRLRRYDHNDWRLDITPIGSKIDPPTSVIVTETDPQSGDADFIAQEYRYAVTAVNADGQESVASSVVVASNDLSMKGDFNTVSWAAHADAVEYRVYAERSGVYGFLGRAIGVLSFKDDNILADFSNGPPTAYDPFTEDDQFPAVSAFHEGRLFYGRTPRRPSAVFASRSDDIFNLDKSSPLEATDSIAVALRGRKVNAIQHMIGHGGLLVLTGNAVWSLQPTVNGFLSPLSIQSRVEVAQGIGEARPAPVGDVLFAATQRGNKIVALGYAFEKDGVRGNDVTVFAQHFFTGFKITHMVYAEVPGSIMFALRNDGKLLALTWQAEQDVWGWTLCDTDGVIESVAVVAEPTRDSLYLAVRREVDGDQVRFIERMAPAPWIEQSWAADPTENAQKDAVVMDAAVTYRGDPTNTLSGLAHLEGTDVAVLADGFVKGGHSVSGGTLVPPLDALYSTISVGRPYASYLTTLPVVSVGTKGAPQVVGEVVLNLMNTQGIVMGQGEERAVGQLYDVEIPDRSGITPPPLFTGEIVKEDFAATDWRDATVTVAQLNPLPMVVLGIHPKVYFGR